MDARDRRLLAYLPGLRGRVVTGRHGFQYRVRGTNPRTLEVIADPILAPGARGLVPYHVLKPSGQGLVFREVGWPEPGRDQIRPFELDFGSLLAAIELEQYVRMRPAIRAALETILFPALAGYLLRAY